MGKSPLHGLDPHQTEIAKLLRANASRDHLFAVFRDFCELAAISISNAVDRLHFEEREARYLKIVGKYQREEVERFPLMLAHLVESLEGGFKDSLGQLFMGMEFGDEYKGQFFTPYNVASLMGQMMIDDVRSEVERKGFITVCEPTVGAGGMIIAVAEAMMNQGVNYQRTLHVTAVDIDATAVHMAYLQLSLLHIPAIVLHGNSLSLEVWGHWVTPAHVLGLWDMRLRSGHVESECDALPVPLTGAPVEEVATAAAVEASIEPVAAAASPDAIAQARKAVVQKRVQDCEQLALFA